MVFDNPYWPRITFNEWAFSGANKTIEKVGIGTQ